MAITVVQTKTGQADNVDSQAITFDSTPTAGNAVIVCIEGWATDVFNPSIPTDNKGNTYYRAVISSPSPAPSTLKALTAIYYTYNISSSATFTVTENPTSSSASTSWLWSISEVSGLTKTDPLDKTFNGSATANPATTGTTAPCAQNDEIVFAAVAIANGTTVTVAVDSASPSWTQIAEELDNSLHQAGEIDYRIITAGGTQTCTWTIDTGRPCVASIATFKALLDNKLSWIKS